jgi:hypothetical protein
MPSVDLRARTGLGEPPQNAQPPPVKQVRVFMFVMFVLFVFLIFVYFCLFFMFSVFLGVCIFFNVRARTGLGEPPQNAQPLTVKQVRLFIFGMAFVYVFHFFGCLYCR